MKRIEKNKVLDIFSIIGTWMILTSVVAIIGKALFFWIPFEEMPISTSGLNFGDVLFWTVGLIVVNSFFEIEPPVRQSS